MLTVRALRSLLAERGLSSVELTLDALERLIAWGPHLGATSHIRRDEAITEARAADARLARGDQTPLLGIPVGVKDVFDIRGVPTTNGSAAFRGNIAREHAESVRRLLRAGAPVPAKLAMSELSAFRISRPGAAVDGACRNPWDLTRWAGGSSGGAGAAVSAGLLPLALAAETAGSIASPSAFCGVSGFRPSIGLVSRSGSMPLSPTLDKVGPIARTVDDCGIALEVLAGRDRRDTASSGRTYRHRDALAMMSAGLSRLRVGFWPADFAELAPEPARMRLQESIAPVESVGLQLRETALPAQLPYRETLDVIMAKEASISYERLIDSDDFRLLSDAQQRQGLRDGRLISLERYQGALRARLQIIRAIDELFETVDLLVSQSCAYPRPIPTIDGTFDFDSLPATGGNRSLLWAGNLAGLPAAFLPVGIGDDGMPVGIQLVGRPGSDEMVVAAGMAFQAITDWHELRPALPERPSGRSSSTLAAQRDSPVDPPLT